MNSSAQPGSTEDLTNQQSFKVRTWEQVRHTVTASSLSPNDGIQ